MTDYDDLVRRLRDYGGAWLAPVGRTHPVCDEAADAIEVLREHVASLESAIMTREHDWARAKRAEADNAALRSENARLLQEVLSPGTIPFNWSVTPLL